MAERKRPKGRKKYVSESDKEAKRRDDQGLGTGPVGSGRDNDGPEDDKGLADGLLGLLGDGTLPPGSSGGSSSGSSSGGLLGGLLGGGSSSGNSSNSGSGGLLGGLLGGGSSSGSSSSNSGSSGLLGGLLGGGGSGGGQSSGPSIITPGGGSSSGGSSGGGGLKKIIIILLVLMLLGGGGGLSGLFNSFFGGGSSSSSGGSGGLDVISNITGGQTDTGTTWEEETTEQEADTNVASGARSKYTTIKGGKKDQITIMIYMCGTDLESRSGMATRDLAEMAKANIGSNVHVVVYTGGCSRWNNSSAFRTFCSVGMPITGLAWTSSTCSQPRMVV